MYFSDCLFFMRLIISFLPTVQKPLLLKKEKNKKLEKQGAGNLKWEFRGGTLL